MCANKILNRKKATIDSRFTSYTVKEKDISKYKPCAQEKKDLLKCQLTVSVHAMDGFIHR